ncbi:MAG: 1-acyl-sn-glycerol-3-phosphate acyltransferase [Chitinophagaceae bacterium]|nr:1-acyl-sn-glycerol-3-phosphate acyltransferase [Chitinophagaceae bacterium]
MKLVGLPFRIIYFIYAVITFIAVMFLILPFVVIGSFFGKIKGGNFIYRACCVWGDLWLFTIGIIHRNLYESPHDKGRQYIFVANHISYFDAPVIVESLRQPVRILGKSEMSKVPFFGFIYRNAIVTVDRSSPEHRAKSVRVLKAVLRKGISIFIFPEGTLNETKKPLKEFYDGAFRIAIETQTPIKPILFLDSFKRLSHESLLSLNPGRSRSIFLDEISVEGLQSKDVNRLKQKVFSIMEQKLIEYKADWIDG